MLIDGSPYIDDMFNVHCPDCGVRLHDDAPCALCTPLDVEFVLEGMVGYE